MSAENLSRFKTAVVIINVIAATLALANIAAMSTRVVEVEPVDESTVWSLDILNRRLLIQTDVNIKNNALYDIRDIRINAILHLEDGTHIMRYHREDMVVPSVSNQEMHLTVAIDLTEETMRRMARLLVADDMLSLDIEIFATYLWGLGWFSMDQTLTFPWTSPLKRVVMEYISEEGEDMLMEGAARAMNSGDTWDFFSTIKAPEVHAALTFMGINAVITEAAVSADTAHICMVGEYSGSAYRIDIIIPLSDILSTTILFTEVHGDG